MHPIKILRNLFGFIGLNWADNRDCQPFTILGSEVSFPFDEKPANNSKNYAGATHTMPLLEAWGVECRLASLCGAEGVFKGFVTDLARAFLDTLSAEELTQVCLVLLD
jgi:dihydroorotate dehydrogenase electron transfer subunit